MAERARANRPATPRGHTPSVRSSTAPANRPAASHLLHLQHTAGNRAVQRFLDPADDAALVKTPGAGAGGASVRTAPAAAGATAAAAAASTAASAPPIETAGDPIEDTAGDAALARMLGERSAGVTAAGKAGVASGMFAAGAGAPTSRSRSQAVTEAPAPPARARGHAVTEAPVPEGRRRAGATAEVVPGTGAEPPPIELPRKFEGEQLKRGWRAFGGLDPEVLRKQDPARYEQLLAWSNDTTRVTKHLTPEEQAENTLTVDSAQGKLMDAAGAPASTRGRTATYAMGETGRWSPT